MTVISKIFSVILSFVMAFLPVGNAFTNEASNTPASDNYAFHDGQTADARIKNADILFVFCHTVTILSENQASFFLRKLLKRIYNPFEVVASLLEAGILVK